MAYVIAEPCIDVKDKGCVDECPVRAIFAEMLELTDSPRVKLELARTLFLQGNYDEAKILFKEVSLRSDQSGLLESLNDLRHVVSHHVNISPSGCTLRQGLKVQVADDLHTGFRRDLLCQVRVVRRIQEYCRRFVKLDLLDEVSHLLGGGRRAGTKTWNDGANHDKSITFRKIPNGFMICDQHSALRLDLRHLPVDPGIQLGKLIDIGAGISLVNLFAIRIKLRQSFPDVIYIHDYIGGIEPHMRIHCLFILYP